jgi:hypothetical protein
MVVAQSGEQINIGEDLSAREYVKWASQAKKGEVFYDNPIVGTVGPAKGKYIIVVSTPVMDEGGKFRGVLASGILIEKLPEKFLSHILEKKGAYVYMVQDDGTFIYTSRADLIGENMVDFIKNHPFLGYRKITDKLEGVLGSGEEGKFDFYIPKNIRGVFPLERRLIAYSPIKIEGKLWYLAVSYPFSETFVFIKPFAFRGALFLLISYSLLLLYSARMARLRGRQEASSSNNK